MAFARRAVEEVAAIKVEDVPLEVFDSRSRFVLFWVRLYGRGVAAKSEARWQAMASDLTLDDLNLATQAWAEQEYHRSHHSEINATPLEHYLAGPSVARSCPGREELGNAFRIEVVRRQRRSDGTVSLNGMRFEIRSRYRHLQQVHLHYAR